MIERLSKFKKAAGFFLGYPLTILSFYFIFKVIFSSFDKLKLDINSVNIPVFGLGIICLTVFYFIRSLIWKMILEKMGYGTELVSSIYLFSFTEIRKYIPGNIFSFASRVDVFNKRFNIPHKTLIKLIFVDFLIMVVSSAFISIPGFMYVKNILFKQGSLNYFNSSILLFGLFLGFVLVFFYLFKKYRFLGLKKTFLKYVPFFDIFLVSCLMWVFFGIGSYFISASLAYIDLQLFIYICSFLVLTWFIGYISLITPAGLGVREAILIAGLSNILPLYVTSLIAVVSRISMIVAEILNLSLLYFIQRVSFAKQIFNWIIVNKHAVILLFLAIIYSAYFNYVAFEKHLNFFTGRFDLGNMDQTVWNTLNGRIFTLTNPDGLNIVSRLGIHADFILILLAPFYVLWQDPRMLLFIQTIVLSFGAIFVYLISKEVINGTGRKIHEVKNLSLVFAVSYLLNPLLQKQNLFDFHPNTLATTFLLAAFFFYIKKKVLYFILFLVLSVLTKENVYLISAVFGLHMLIKGKRLYGAIMVVSSLLLFYLLVAVFIPQARGQDHFAISYYQQFGDSPAQIIKNIVLYPDKSILSLITVDSLKYFSTLMVSTGFIQLFNPWYLIFAGPTLFINLLSGNQNMMSINFHYAATIIPFMYISSVYGAKFILTKCNKVNIKILTCYILFFSLLSSWMFGVLPGSQHPSVEVFNSRTANNKEIKRFLSQVPSDISVAATNNLGAHLTHREKIYTVPNGVYEADMTVFLLNDVFAKPSPDEQAKMVENLKLNRDYRLVKEIGGVFWVFEKIRTY
ncbi:DUF2079 domain-containing protein [Candidatus Parcubacteria bacterium]|nr:MAG: DUF2079 domain-containing protein [Candidatus Parcubacteria bacterium]